MLQYDRAECKGVAAKKRNRKKVRQEGEKNGKLRVQITTKNRVENFFYFTRQNSLRIADLRTGLLYDSLDAIYLLVTKFYLTTYTKRVELLFLNY